MLDIPTDLNTWHPNEIGAWAADRAVTAALLGDELAVEIHGPVSP